MSKKKKKQHNLLKLSYGDHYADQDYKILYACFDLFMDYLDEAARVHCAETYNSKGKHAAIIEYLDWNISLGDPGRLAEENFELNPLQAWRGQQKKELYLWWTQKRPYRKETLLDDSGYAEDDAMLIKLIGIRASLWV